VTQQLVHRAGTPQAGGGAITKDLRNQLKDVAANVSDSRSRLIGFQ
jgi:hypothetical protein